MSTKAEKLQNPGVTKAETAKPAFANIAAAGRTYATAELQLGNVADYLRTVQSVAPKWDAYKAARAEFVTAYAAKAGCKDETAGKAWTRAIARAGIETPKAPSAAATRKAGERAKREAKIEELIKSHKGDTAKIKAALPTDANPDTVKLYADAMLKADKANQKVANDKAKKLADAMAKRLPKMSVEQLELLARAADMIESGHKLVFQPAK